MANDKESKQQKTEAYIEAIWEKERRLERYALEIKAHCEAMEGRCEECYFGKPPREDQFYPSWDCKFNADQPEDWEVE